MKSPTLLILLLIFCIYSCGGLKTSSYFVPPKSEIKNYSALEIYDFESTSAKFPAEGLVKIPDRIKEKLDDRFSSKFEYIERGNVDRVPDSQILVLLGEIEEFKSSSDVKYEGGAVKFGELSLNVSVAIVQKDNGKEITSGEISSFSSFGYGKSGEDLYETISDEVVNYIINNY